MATGYSTVIFHNGIWNLPLTTCIMDSIANSDDPDEMQHYAAFHQGHHCLYIKVKTIFRRQTNTIFFYDRATLDMYNGLSQVHVYCIKPEGKSNKG